MQPELVGQTRQAGGRAGRFRPVAGGPFALVAFVTALLPISPSWLWAALIACAAAAPWAVGLIAPRRPVPYWRLSASGLEQLADGRTATPNWLLRVRGLARLLGGRGASRSGEVITRYERERIEEFAITAEDGCLTVVHKFGRAPVGELVALGFEPLAFYVTARRLGIPVRVLDGDAAQLADESPAARQEAVPDQVAEQRLLAQEADLLAAAHQPRGEPRQAGRPPARLSGPPSRPGRGRLVAVGTVVALLSAVMVGRIAAGEVPDFTTRLSAACWAAAGLLGLLAVRRRLLGTGRVDWTISPERIVVGGRANATRLNHEVQAGQIAALVVGPGIRTDPLTGETRASQLTALAFDHRLGLLARLPAEGLDAFQLAHELDEHGYRVITPSARAPRPSGYGLDGLPEIFSQVPGGRLVVADDGLGWADAAGAVVLRMPADRIGGIELLTVAGHAWLRLYDSDGDEFFAAPLSALRISRTDLRESARRAGLPVTDAEYDAYLSAAFHNALQSLHDDLADPQAPRPGSRGGVLDPRAAPLGGDALRHPRTAPSGEGDPGDPRAGQPGRDDSLTDPRAAGSGRDDTIADPQRPRSRQDDDALDPRIARSGDDDLPEPQAAPSYRADRTGPRIPARHVAGSPSARPGQVDGVVADPDFTSGVLLDATRRSRVGTYLLSVLLCEAVALLGALWLGEDLGGFGPTLAWAAPAGLVIGVVGYWTYDRNRDQLRVSQSGIAMVSRRGRVAWTLNHGRVGGVGIDDSVERLPRLVVWSPAGRVLRQVSFPPDLNELRRACERYGLPWGPPDADRPALPPPEL